MLTSQFSSQMADLVNTNASHSRKLGFVIFFLLQGFSGLLEVRGLVCRLGNSSVVAGNTYACAVLVAFNNVTDYSVMKSTQYKAAIRLRLLQDNCILLVTPDQVARRPIQQCYCTVDHCNENILVIDHARPDWRQQVSRFARGWDQRRAANFSLLDALVHNMQQMPDIRNSSVSGTLLRFTERERNVKPMAEQSDVSYSLVAKFLTIVTCVLVASCIVSLAIYLATLALRRRRCQIMRRRLNAKTHPLPDLVTTLTSSTSSNAHTVFQEHFTGSVTCNYQVTSDVLYSSSTVRVLRGVVLPDENQQMMQIAVKQMDGSGDNYNYHSWRNASNVMRYLTQFGDHKNITKFVCSSSHMDGPSQFVLVTELQDNGNLRNYLRNNVIKWGTLLRLTRGVAEGLAFLHQHSQLAADGRYKVPIAHRNLDSSNVLLSANLTPKLGGFGFARIIESHEDLEKLPLVGSEFYQAPEVLDGCVEHSLAALLCVDLYSFGIVMWEMQSRCAIEVGDGFQVQNREYQMPLPIDCPPNPSIQQLKNSVCVNKSRPPISAQWRTHRLGRHFTRVIEETWDDSPLCRLHARRVEVKMADLMHRNDVQ